MHAYIFPQEIGVCIHTHIHSLENHFEVDLEREKHTIDPYRRPFASIFNLCHRRIHFFHTTMSISILFPQLEESAIEEMFLIEGTILK